MGGRGAVAAKVNGFVWIRVIGCDASCRSSTPAVAVVSPFKQCIDCLSTTYQGCIWYNVNSFFVRTTTSRHSASRACYAIILTVSDPILCNKSIYIIVKRNFLRDSAARYHLPPPARASSTDDPMTHLSRFSNGNATARFWQKVTTGLFKRRLHRVLDSKRRHILTYIDDIHHEDHFFPL